MDVRIRATDKQQSYCHYAGWGERLVLDFRLGTHQVADCHVKRLQGTNYEIQRMDRSTFNIHILLTFGASFGADDQTQNEARDNC